jgi:hypothetical protein
MSTPRSDIPTPVVVPCAPCAAGPAGIEGHAHLRVRALGNLAVRFECRDCRQLWSRSDVAGGGFAWVRVDGYAPVDRRHSAGVPVPQR